MPFLVRLRPNAAYLAFLALGVVMIGLGASMSGVLRMLLIAGGLVFAVLLGAPVVASTIFRVPVLAVSGDGIRLPLMGVRLGWHHVVRVSRTTGAAGKPVLLIVPADPQAVSRRVRPWVRSEARANMARYGTPVVMTATSMDRTLDEIESAVTRLRPVPPA